MANSETTVSLSQIDTNHLAKQALKLFSKRYGRLFDTNARMMGISGQDSISYEVYLKFCEQGYSGLFADNKIKDIAKRNWFVLTGGQPEIKQITRQQSIDLTVRGFHSKDRDQIKTLMAEAQELAGFNFDLIDLNKDGHISKEEYYVMAKRFDDIDAFGGTFEAMDLNGDGVISKEEFLKCYEGFYLYVDEERYNHILGIVED